MARRPVRSLTLPCAIYAPGRRVAHLHITLKNVPGALARVTSLLEAMRVNILSGHITALPGRPEGHVSIFVDLTNSYSSLDEIRAQLEKIDVVIGVRAFEPEMPGIIIDTAHFPLKFMGEEAVIMDIRHIEQMFGRLDEVFETGAYVILYEMGYRAGRAFAREVEEAFDMGKEDILRIIGALAIPRGWCIPEIVEWDEEAPRLVVRMRGLFTCKPFAGKRRRPTGHFMRGVLAGMVEELTGVRVKAKEVKCVAVGDPYCEFVVEKVEKWAR